MQLTALLTQKDLVDALFALAPLRLHFTEKDEDTRWVEVDRPSEIALLPNEGLRLACAGRTRYTAQGVPFEAEFHRIQMLITPQVLEREPHSSHLCFALKLEELDVKHVPAFIDKWITQRVDGALSAETTNLAWKFSKTLSFRFAIPARFEPITRIGLEVVGGRIAVTDAGVEFVVHYAPVQVERSTPKPTSSRSGSPEPTSATRKASPVDKV